MSAEHSARENLILASKINRICDIVSADQIDESVLQDAQQIINSMSPRIEVSESSFELSFYTPSKPFGGLMSTGNGDLQNQVNLDKSRKEFQFGKENEERLGLYRISKDDVDKNFALNFTFFWKQIDSTGKTVNVGPITHLLYQKDNNLLKAIPCSTL